MLLPKIVKLKSIFTDQSGTAKRGSITGYNGVGIPCRKYTWIEPTERRGQTFEAFDTQIKKALIS